MSHDFRVTVGRNAGTIHTVSNGFFFFEVYGDKDEAQKVCDKMNELDRLAEANEEQGLAIMTYLHNNYYDIWEEVNKEVFKE